MYGSMEAVNIFILMCCYDTARVLDFLITLFYNTTVDLTNYSSIQEKYCSFFFLRNYKLVRNGNIIFPTLSLGERSDKFHSG